MTAANPAPVRVVSFGYGHGDAPAAHLTLDLRHHFPGAGADPEMRGRTIIRQTGGRRGILGTPGLRTLLAATVRAVRAYDSGPYNRAIVVAVGGGRIRAVVAAEALARRLRRRGHDVLVEHHPAAR
ncbi:hypothetical protein [Streptomyces sp. NRRL S-455]|uniref:RapZ C-terminal domain-containing protein n=1 Tax=Streptomyces sp. NRRL S-455 TaxID=1463908 RepID=UPI0004C09ECA|nr:hypothetical protein [Streptomyces sp. NRRL S-455]